MPNDRLIMLDRFSRFTLHRVNSFIINLYLIFLRSVQTFDMIFAKKKIAIQAMINSSETNIWIGIFLTNSTAATSEFRPQSVWRPAMGQPS